MSERIAQAYHTLIAEESRRLYDEELGIRRRLRVMPEPEADERLAAASSRSHGQGVEVAEEKPHSVKPQRSQPPEPRVCPLELGPSEEATGDFFRRAREVMDVDLATISRETKIGCAMLEYIETERLGFPRPSTCGTSPVRSPVTWEWTKSEFLAPTLPESNVSSPKLSARSPLPSMPRGLHCNAPASGRLALRSIGSLREAARLLASGLGFPSPCARADGSGSLAGP